MKRLISILLAVVLVIACLGCGRESSPTKRGDSDKSTKSGSNSEIRPDGKDPDDPSGSSRPNGSGDHTVAVTWMNWKDCIEFYQVEDRSRVAKLQKVVDYTFGVRAKEGYELMELSLKMNATLYYRCGKADMGEHLEKDIVLTLDQPTYTIHFEAADLINYNGRIVESVFYNDVVAVTGKVVKK